MKPVNGKQVFGSRNRTCRSEKLNVIFVVYRYNVYFAVKLHKESLIHLPARRNAGVIFLIKMTWTINLPAIPVICKSKNFVIFVFGNRIR